MIELKRRLPFVLAMVVIAIIGFLGLYIYSGANAGTIKGDSTNCLHLALTAMEVAEHRDAGMLWTEAGPRLQIEIAQAIGQSGTWIADADDAEFTYRTFEKVWSEKVPVSVIGEKTYRNCMLKMI